MRRSTGIAEQVVCNRPGHAALLHCAFCAPPGLARDPNPRFSKEPLGQLKNIKKIITAPEEGSRLGPQAQLRPPGLAGFDDNVTENRIQKIHTLACRSE